MTVLSFDDTDGNGITRDAPLDASDVFDSRVKNANYGGTGGSNNNLLFYQGSACAARKAGSTGGHGYTVGNYTARDTTTATYRSVMSKMWITNYLALNPAGMDFCIGSGTGAAIGNNQHYWTVADDGTIPAPGWEHPPVGGWIIKPIDVTLRAFRRGETGTPDETAMLNFGAWVDLNSTGGTDQNLLLDSPDWIETGFHVTGGTGTDPSVTFADVVDQDEGNASTNFGRVGLWRTVEGVIYFFGKLEVGRTYGNNALATEFDDSFQTLVCPGGYVREGFNTLEFDQANTSTVHTIDNITVIGRGRSGLKRLFNANATGSGGAVNATLNTITYTDHGFETGEQVLYSQEGETGTVISLTGGESQLVTGTTGAYYYVINQDANTFALASSFANSLAGTNVSLTAQSGEIHSFARTPDTRPDLTFTGTAGTSTVSSCSLTSLRNIALQTNVSVSDTNIITCQSLTMNGGTLTDCAISSPTLWAGEPFITTANMSAINGCTFTGGSELGHAVELTANGTYSSTDNTFSGYGADDSDTAAIYNNSGGAITLNITGGTTPTVRNGAGSSTTLVINPVTTTVNVVDELGIALANARVYLEAEDGSGDLPFGNTVTITRTGGTANVVFNSHGMANGELVMISGANQAEYNGVKTVANSLTNTFTFGVTGSPTTPATGTITATGVLINELTTAGGLADDTRSMSVNQPVTGWVRKSDTLGGSPHYRSFNISGTVDNATGLSISVQMIRDD